MRRVLLTGLGWVLGSAPLAHADDRPMPAAPPGNEAVLSAPAVTLGTPRAATLGAPRPLAATAPSDSALTPATYATASPAPYLARGQLPETKPMPNGPGKGSSDNPSVGPPPRALESSPQPGPMIPGLSSAPAPDCGYPSDLQPFAGAPCCTSGQASRSWVSAEYLLWWVKNDHIPALVTTDVGATPPDLTNPLVGGLGSPTTAVVFGGRDLEAQQRSGFRISAGWWCDPCNLWGVDGSFFILPTVSRSFSISQATAPNGFLARPFFSANNQILSAEGVTAPGLTTAGGVGISTHGELWGADVNLRRNLLGGCFARLDLIGGFRFLSLTEDLQIAEAATGDLTSGNPSLIFQNSFGVDRFSTENRFYGGQIGLAGEARYGRFFVNGCAKVALGTMSQQSDIAGGIAFTPVGAPITQVNTVVGGLLALPSNIGHREQNKFAAVPELTINFGVNLTERLRVFTGYNFLYASSVLRPGDQIDPVLNVNEIPGFPQSASNPTIGRPAAPMRTTDFWAQGVNFGLEFRW